MIKRVSTLLKVDISRTWGQQDKGATNHLLTIDQMQVRERFRKPKFCPMPFHPFHSGRDCSIATIPMFCLFVLAIALIPTCL